ncbi:hypothetical protein [Halomicrococcus sp. SG-WS-1]|uniref:hypothetical protein n=1 Tax=Halomicrococcus sp. SG-WS-1 TaxID=3439057 RepID=UPI003F7992D1
MSASTARSVLRPERPLLVFVFVLVSLVTVWLFVPTMLGHAAVTNADNVDVTATDARVTDDGRTLAVAFQIHNPTHRAISVSAALVHVYDGDARVSDGTTTPFQRTVVPAGETRTVTLGIGIRDGYEERVRQGTDDRGFRYSGKLRGTIADRTVDVDVDSGGGKR